MLFRFREREWRGGDGHLDFERKLSQKGAVRPHQTVYLIQYDVSMTGPRLAGDYWRISDKIAPQ